MNSYRLWPTKMFNKFFVACFMIVVFFQYSCAVISKNREIDSKKSTFSKSKEGEKILNKKLPKIQQHLYHMNTKNSSTQNKTKEVENKMK